MQLIGLNLKVTNRCNMKCEFCYRDKMKVDDLKYSDIKNILKYMKELNARTLRISGGEPLLYEELMSVIQLANDYNIDTAIATNGILLNSNVAKNLENSGLKGLHFSLGDMVDIRKNMFIKEKIKAIRDTKITIGINIITSKKFIDNIESNIEWILDNLDIDYINCIIPKKGDNINWYSENKIDVNDFYSLKNALDGSGINYNFDCGYYVSTISDNRDCWLFNLEYKFLTIATNGYIYECPYACEDKFSLGYYDELKEIIESYNNKYDLVSIPCK